MKRLPRWAAAFCDKFDGVPIEKKVHVVLEYLRNNPERAQLRAIVGVEEALHKAFPCR